MSSRFARLALVLGLALSASLFTVPAEAAAVKGRICKTHASVQRCAGFRTVDAHGVPRYVQANVSATGRNGAVADLDRLHLQRVVNGRWTTIRAKNPPYGYSSLEAGGFDVRCRRMQAGVYRVRGKVKWINGGGAGTVWIKSHAMTKAELC